MKIFCFIILVSGLCSCDATKKARVAQPVSYTPDDKILYATIVKHDSLFFASYNSCDRNLETYASYFSEDIEFYHDKGGVMTSKQAIVEATRKNVCGKVTRRLIAGSMEVYPIANYGAVQIGYHTFTNNTEPPVANPRPGRFVITWRYSDSSWKITRVISLH